MVSPTPPLAGPLRSRRRQRRRAAGPSGSWFASLRRGPRTRRMWGGKKRLGLPFRCPSQRFLSRKLDPACWTSHLSPCRGCRRLKGETFSSLLSGTAGLLRISPFFPAPRPPSPPRHVSRAVFLLLSLRGRLGGRVPVVGRGEGPQKVFFPAFASPDCQAILCPRLATGNRRPWISPIGAPRVRRCFSLVLSHLHARTCNFIFIACFPLT